jgi:hypothetical protein
VIIKNISPFIIPDIEKLVKIWNTITILSEGRIPSKKEGISHEKVWFNEK